MSEGSKMGLFGSKDEKTESTTDETTKPDSPDRYAPYCIDSDSETYDTEALSIMDINDIIGVQTGQAVESTLESEIAALSEIITDSKSETSCDAMNEITGENSNMKFNEELLSEFTSLSASENPVPTTSRKILEEHLDTVEPQAENIYGETSGKAVSISSTSVAEESTDPSSKQFAEVITSIEIKGEVITEAENTAISPAEQNVELDETKAESQAENQTIVKSSLSSAARNVNDIAQNDETLAAKEAEPLVKTDNVNESINSAADTVGDGISQAAMDSSKESLEAVKTGLNDEKIEDNSDSSKCQDVTTGSIQDAVTNKPNVVEDIDSVVEIKSEVEEITDACGNGKLTALLTNVGSTSKSLQLIGEAYISEDSQETDEKDASPVVDAVSFVADEIEEEETVEKDKPQVKSSSDDTLTDTVVNESKIIVMADTPASGVEKCNSDDRDSASLEDNKKPDNREAVSPNLEDNREHYSPIPSCDSQINVESKNDQVTGEVKPVDPSLIDDQNTDKSNEFAEIPSVLTASVVANNNSASKTTSLTELLETSEEILPESEQSKDVSSNLGTEAGGNTTEGAVFKLEANRDPEEIQEKDSEEVKAHDEAMEFSEIDAKTLKSSSETASDVDISMRDPEPVEKPETSASLVSICSNTDLESTTEAHSEEIQIKNTKVTESVEPSEPIDEQDKDRSLESNTENELIASRSSEKSPSSLPHSNIEDKFVQKISEPSMSTVEMGTNLDDRDNQCTATTTSPRTTISIDEPSQEISDNAEQVLETVEENIEKRMVDDTIQREDIPLVVKATDNDINDENDKYSSIHKMIESIRKEEAKSHSALSDNTSQLMSLESTSRIVEKTDIDSSSNMTINKGNVPIEQSEEKTNEAERLATELDQSTSGSYIENTGLTRNIMDENKPEERESSERFYGIEESSSSMVKADSLSSEIVEQNLNEQRDDSTEMEIIEMSKAQLSKSQIKVEAHIDSQRDALDSETVSSVTREEVLDPTTGATLENITTANVGLKSFEVDEAHVSDGNLSQQETIEKSPKLKEIVEAERENSKTLVESEILETDEDEVSKAQACDKTEGLEDESISESSLDIEKKQAEVMSDKDNRKIVESKSIEESIVGTVSNNTTVLEETEIASKLNTLQDPIENDSNSDSKPKDDTDGDELKIQSVQQSVDSPDISENQQEIFEKAESIERKDEIQSEKLSNLNIESSSSGVTLGTKSEVLLDVIVDNKDESEIHLEKSGNQAELQAVVDESLHSILPDKVMEAENKADMKVDMKISENPAEIICDFRSKVRELKELESESTVARDVSKLLEKDAELEEAGVVFIKSVDDENLGDITNIQPPVKDLESSQTPSGSNEAEDDLQEPVLNLIDETTPIGLQSDNLIESGVKMSEVLQCEPIEVLEKLTAVADDILIDELANSVLKETAQPLESINVLGLLPDSHLSMSTVLSSEDLRTVPIVNEFCEVKDQPVSLLGEINETCFIGDLNQTPSVSHGANYVTDVIRSSTNIENIQLVDNMRDMDDENVTDEFERRKQEEVVKISENVIPKDITSIDQEITNVSEARKIEIEENFVLDKDIEIDLPLKQEEEKLIQCAVLQVCDDKIILPDEVLFSSEDAEQTDVLCNTPADNADTSQQSSEFSELECAVKFLQESEEQIIDSPLLLSPKIAEEIVEENSEQSKSCLFLSETEVCQDNLELPAELVEITADSIAISEAEIISEAAKLENERKLKIAAEISKTSETIEKLVATEDNVVESNSEMLKSLLTTSQAPSWQEKSEENLATSSERSQNTQLPKLSENIIRRSEKIPKISILEERLKEPPKIEIPVPEVSPKISDTPTTPRTSLLIQRDSKIDTKTMYQKMLESPKGGDKSEPKIMDTPRKDADKHDFENVGSPRIILKIAKSAIADCGEPRSPKSPKIRSAANSPNPEDSPGQKLGKIKLKLSKGGHPSIISNENFDETTQRHTDAILSPSHIGMKIKLSKTGDASIIQPDKHDSIDEMKESKHKYDEASPKRIESPLGMKIKLSKTGDPSIVQQESKDSTSKRKDKLDIGQEVPKRTDSPLGMKIKLSKSGDASIIQPEKQDSLEDAGYKDKLEIAIEIPKRTESPIGMKFKLSKTGDASIISSESCEEYKDTSSKSRDKLSTNQDIPKRTDSPLGIKFKLSKSGGASIIQPERSEAFEDFKDKSDNVTDITKRVESPIGMKIKLLRTGDASIIHPEKQESEEYRESTIMKHREKSETQEIQKRTDSPIGMRIKVTKSGEASVVPPEEFKESSSLNTEGFDMTHEVSKRNESPIGMKIKLSKSGDASIIHPEKQEFFDESKDCNALSRSSLIAFQEGSKSSEASLGMKIKLSKTGDASIIHPEISPESKDTQLKRTEKLQSSGEGSKRTDSPLGMKIKLSKTGDASIIEPDKKEKLAAKQKEKLTNVQEVSQKRKEMEFPLEMKIKLSKTGHPTIIANEKQESLAESHSKSKDYSEGVHKRAEPTSPTKDAQLRIFKTGHSTIIQSSRSEVTIEPIQMLPQKPENSMDISPKCKDVIISAVDSKKSKLEAKLSQILPEVTIQPVMSGEQKQIMLDKKSNTISRQQMSVINQEISITQVPLSKPADLSMSGKLKEILRKNATNSPATSDCEIIEHRPELIIVNENSNSSQDIMIIEEVKVPVQEVKIPRKRGRPKRSSLPPGQLLKTIPQDPLALDNMQTSASGEHRESDRPKRTCRNQKSYAPPKRGRGRGRGKRKMDRLDCAIGKIPRLEDPLTAIERSTMSLIAPLQPSILPEGTAQTSELYKALKQSATERKRLIPETIVKHGFPDGHKKMRLETESGNQLASDLLAEPRTEQHLMDKSIAGTSDPKAVMISEMLQFSEPITAPRNIEKLVAPPKPEIQETKNIISDLTTTEHQNWLTPSIKLPETTGKTEAISMVQVMDEETRMSAESNSRSQTPARNISLPAVETVINEESQGSVLSTATTESEKVKVKNRRMEINFDPDEGPFTVDKIAEYEWPLDKKGDTFMLQEQISQYLGVKSFKRKYPDLKRRMVEMEERNFLRENCLVSEAMCDMGLTAICSTEVLDIMCSDFPDQYEEYRKHMREKQAKEHSKKQKELTAAANAERNRIDLAEMAVQSALSWNVNFNKARKESRKYSLDLQSFTIHVPKKQQKVDAERKVSNYPVALIPGQYTDYYREYTPAELRYYPLNTVLYGPMRPNERKFDSQSEGSQSDSDSDSSSDDSSSSSSEGTQDTEESQSTVDDVDIEIAAHKEDNKNLKCKMCLKHLNKHGKAEVLIQCGTCNGNVHPSCIDLTLDMVPHIQGYSWQCTDCKTCVQCHNPADEDKMLFCDMCDRGYHIYCVGLRRVPQGRWHCRECAVCASCGLRQPGGANSDRNSVAQWQHEYKKGERNTRVYVSTLCVPCSKLWRKGRYCPHCSRCHSAQRLDLEPNLIHCGACDKYLHLGCVEIRSGTLDRKNYICECCSTPSQQLSRSFISKTFKT